jgi:4-amino-4-deoxychorismate lyase
LSVWINGRRGRSIDCRDRGLQYGDGLFETMLVRRRVVRLLEFHLERLFEGCRRLQIIPPKEQLLRRELARAARLRSAGILKLIVTRGRGGRGYRPSGRERCTRIVMLSPLPAKRFFAPQKPVKLRICATRLATNTRLAGLKTLNALESVLARSEWTDAGIREGLMLDADENIVCGTMSNLFLKRGSTLVTPLLDRCGVAGVMRRWVLEQAGSLRLRGIERRIRWADLRKAEEVFMTNAVVGIMPVTEIIHAGVRVRPARIDTARSLCERLDRL